MYIYTHYKWSWRPHAADPWDQLAQTVSVGKHLRKRFVNASSKTVSKGPGLVPRQSSTSAAVLNPPTAAKALQWGPFRGAASARRCL